METPLQFRPLSFTAYDEQWLVAEQEMRQRIAAIFHIPPHLLGTIHEQSAHTSPAPVKEEQDDGADTPL